MFCTVLIHSPKIIMMFRKKYTSKEIIAGLLSHDLTIYRYIDAEYRPKVICHVRCNSGSVEEGEELYQDVFYKVYVNVEQGKYDPERGEFGAYFMTIVRSTWLNKLRDSRKSIPTTPLDGSYRQISDWDEAEEAEEDLYYRRVQVVRECITRLSEEEQQMIDLYYFAKKSLKTVAEEMGFTYEYAKQKILRIRNKIRKMLKDYPDVDLQFI